MIGTRLFRKHFAITLGVVAGSIVAGIFVSETVMRMATQNLIPASIHSPAVLFAKLIDELGNHDHVVGLTRLRGVGGEALEEELVVLDADGHSLSAPSIPIPPWGELKKPQTPYEFAPVFQGPPGAEHRGPPPPPGFRPPGEGPGPMFEGLVRFPGEPAQYLYMRHPFHPHMPGGHPPFFMFLVTIGCLIASVIAGVTVALVLLFRSMREKMRLADSVIDELRRGNLKARFPIGGRLDEAGEAMVRFNRMAEEIEHLVERLRQTERSRMALLQELTHDLRTPIASLSNLLAVIGKKNNASEGEIRGELLGLAQKEIEYFGRLVEDLLILAQLSEPGYQASRKPSPLSQILEEEIESVLTRLQGTDRKITIEGDIDSDIELVGDPHLLRRLLRNALDNAASFAKTRVRVSLHSKDGGLELLITDDGPGLTPAALAAYGERRISRILDKSEGGRLSVGLGSVIMKTVAELHRGKIEIANVAPKGARVTITLPA